MPEALRPVARRVTSMLPPPPFPRWPLVLGGLLLAGLSACIRADGESPLVVGDRIQAVTLDARQPPPPGFLAALRRQGVTHLTLVSFGFQPGHDVPEIRLHNDARWYSESDRGIRALARKADSLGLRLILKPHLWVGRYDGGGMTRDSIAFATETGWQAWEAQYRTFVMHYAHLAQEVDADVLVIGTELARAVQTRPAFWRSLIAEIRTVYGGALTYAANWWQEAESVPFWDALDYVGIQAYYELSRADDPPLALLRDGWTPYRKTLRRLSEATGRPVLFTEIGYRSVPYAAAQPWRWPSRDEAGVTPPDDALQARLYQAFFESVWHEPWFAGAILWKWYPDPGQRRHALDFTPQHKPAEQVIAQWFTRRATPAAGAR